MYMEFVPEGAPGGQVLAVQPQPWQQQWEAEGNWQQQAGWQQQQGDLGDPWQQALWPVEGAWYPGYQPPAQAGYPPVAGQPGYPMGEQGSFQAGDQVGWQGQPPCSPEPPVFPAVYRCNFHFQPLTCTRIPVAMIAPGCTSSLCHAGSSTIPVTHTTAAILSTRSSPAPLCQPFPHPIHPPAPTSALSAQGRWG